MFKFLVLSALVAVAAAAPSSSGWYGSSHSHQHQQQHIVELPQQHVVVHHHEQPEYAHVGNIVNHIPVATSHQSRTDYHSTPIVKTVLQPIEYIQPVVHQVQHHHQHQLHEPTVVYTSSHHVDAHQPWAVGSVTHHGAHHDQYSHEHLW